MNEIEVAHRLRDEMDRIRSTLPPDVDMQMAYDATVFMEDALKEISKTLTETILIVGWWCSWARSALHWCHWWRCPSRWWAQRS